MNLISLFLQERYSYYHNGVHIYTIINHNYYVINVTTVFSMTQEGYQGLKYAINITSISLMSQVNFQCHKCAINFTSVINVTTALSMSHVSY